MLHFTHAPPTVPRLHHRRGGGSGKGERPHAGIAISPFVPHAMVPVKHHD